VGATENQLTTKKHTMKRQPMREYEVTSLNKSTGKEQSDRYDKLGLVQWLKKDLSTKIIAIKWRDQVLY
jgi:hypothetical protein